MNTDPTWLVRLIEVYSIETEEFVREHQLPRVELVELQRLWGQPEDDPMFEMFEVTDAQRPFVEAALGSALDLDAHSYFLSTRCSDPDAMYRDGGFMGMFAPPQLLAAFPDAAPARPKRD
jgi:hypothetical protein